MTRDELAKYRKAQCAAYREQTDKCEISAYLRRCPEFRKWEANHKMPGLSVHHLWGRDRVELNAFCVLVMSSTAAHEFGHQKGGLSYNVGLAFEACCLMAKWERHRRFPGHFEAIDWDKQHWSYLQMDAARSVCISHKTLDSRVDFLHERLRESIFGDVTAKLMEVVN